MNKKRLLFITPHLSTGGLPQYLYKKIESLKDSFEIFVIEYSNYSDEYVVQKNRIKTIIKPDHFYTLGENKYLIINILDKIKPNIIHFEEIPEHFISDDIAKQIYVKNRKYFIVETSHDSTFDINRKRFLPDKFMHVSKYLFNKYQKFNILSEIIEYPIENKSNFDKNAAQRKLAFDPEYKHILNVGLFTPGKNQKQIFEIAKLMINDKVQFHFVGNLAINFKDYWEPLLKNKPKNCIIHFERDDVEDFYAASDLFLFTSTFELNPLVVKEALSYRLPILMYNLDTYCGSYNNIFNINFLAKDNKTIVQQIKNIIGYDNSKRYIAHTTINYIETTFGLIYSVLEHSKYPITIFTVNFNIKDIANNPFKDNERVKFEQYNDHTIAYEGKMIDADYQKYVDRNDDSIFQILTLKPKILLEAFKLGIDEGIYLDSDLICRYNIDDLMEYTKKVYKFPLLPRGVYDILLDENGNGDIERPLMKWMHVEERSMEYVQSNIIVFNSSCIDFIKEWNYICLNPEIISNWKKLAPYHEETIINVLFWKYKNTQYLPMVFMNIRNKRFVEEFYKFDTNDKSKYSIHMKGFPFYIDGKQMSFTYIPWEKEEIKAFHGIKSLDEIREIIKFEREINE